MKRVLTAICIIYTLVTLLLAVVFIIYRESRPVRNESVITLDAEDWAYIEEMPGYNPPEGVVPDATTAILIAEAVWLPIYGETIYTERPFKAYLWDGQLWYVHGSLPPNTLGGTATAIIRKSDGTIVKVWHGK